MSQKTIQGYLIANEQSRQEVWRLTSECNTPLINQLISQIVESPDFEGWCKKGLVPQTVVKELCQKLKEGSQFAGQPGRFYTSAITVVSRIFKSWIRRRNQLFYRLEGKKQWLQILQSDEDFAKNSDCDLEAIRAKASEILSQLASDSDRAKPEQANDSISGQKSQKLKKLRASSSTSQQKNRKSKRNQEEKTKIGTLFELYRDSDDKLTQTAVAYLLKNGGKLPTSAEDPKKFAKRRRKAEIAVERLEGTLKRMRTPNGRDWTEQKWLETLATAASKTPEDEDEVALWQAILLPENSRLPFPITYETNEDLTWSLNEKGRLCVSFNGLGEHTFEIYCDQRQLHWFKRFLEDQEVKKASKGSHSAGLFTLRSARIAWQVGEGEGEPWTANRLVLFCTVETRLWTTEGTEQIRAEKATEYAKVIASTKAKGNLTKQQEQFVKSREKTLALINNPFPRPSSPPYKGQPSILAGVSYGLDRPATLAIVDITTGKAITYCSIRQLLGDHYKLLNRYRLQQQRNSHRRHNNQCQGALNRIQESNVGDHLDCLIARAIVTTAQKYQVSSIIVPDLSNIREVIEAEIQARAEQKIIGYLEGQRQYAKQYRATVHRWSYSRLTEKIQSQAAQVGIAVELEKQPCQGTAQEKAKNIAIAAYSSRKKRA